MIEIKITEKDIQNATKKELKASMSLMWAQLEHEVMELWEELHCDEA